MENTIPSFLEAIESGANSIELDVVPTKDGHLAVFHDFEIGPESVRRYDGKPVTGSIAIRSLTLAELSEYYVEDPRRMKVDNKLTPAQRKIPTLGEVFEAVRSSAHPNAKRIVVDVELKSEPDLPLLTLPPGPFAKAVMKSVAASGMSPRVAVRSFDHRTLSEIRKIDKGIPIAALGHKGALGFEGDYERVVRELGPQVVAPSIEDVTPELVSKLHALGARVIPYTCNRPDQWELMLIAGVDGMTTDSPRALASFLETKHIGQDEHGTHIYGCAPDFRHLKN